MTKGTAFNLATLLFVVAALTISAYGVRDRQRQIAFLCTTSGGLATVLDNAAKQIEVNFDNGTYRNLLKKHIITEKNIEQAHKTHNSYVEQVARLRDPHSPCVGAKETAH